MSEIKVVLGLLPSLQILIGKEEGDKIKDCARIISSPEGSMVAPLFMQLEKGRKKAGFHLPKGLFIIFDEPENAVREGYMQYMSKIDIATKKVHLPKHLMN